MSIQLRVPETIFMPDFLESTLIDGGDMAKHEDYRYSQPLDWQGFCKLGERTTKQGTRWPESVSLLI